MGYHVEYDTPHECVVVTRTGSVNLSEVQESLDEAFALALNKGCTRLLGDNTLATSAPSIVATIQLVRERLENTGIRAFRIAVVAPRGSETAHRMRNLETIAVNRGLRVQAFKDLDDAFDWLAEGAQNEH